MYSSQPFTLARLSLLILICSHVAAAQYRLESWTNDNGLQNIVRSITQTRDGYLSLTTFDGLVRFDGVQFKVFNTNNTSGLTSNRFTALYDGTLWIGTNSDATVSVISTASNTVTATVPVGNAPVHIAFAVRTQRPTGKDQCKQGGWQTFTNPSFKNEGDCVSFVNHMNQGKP